MLYPVRLYSLHHRILRHDDLAAIGAPERPGIFEPCGAWQDALCALAAHRVAAVDPVPWPYIGPVWWGLRRDDGGAYVGPPIFFDQAAIRPPPLPAGGVDVNQVLRKYLAGVPGTVVQRSGRHGPPRRSGLLKAMVELAAAEPRIAVRQYRNASPIWRRTVAGPRLRDPRELEAWLAGEKALPSPAALAAWYRQARAEHWHRLAIGRLLDDLAAGEFTAWDGAEPIPATWWQSDVELDLRAGALYGPNDPSRPLATGLRLHPDGDKPRAAVEREAIARAEGGARHVLGAAIDTHRDVLVGLGRRNEQVAWLQERIPPGIATTTISARLRTELGALDARGPVSRRGRSRKHRQSESSRKGLPLKTVAEPAAGGRLVG